jgi:hypothetical protein
MFIVRSNLIDVLATFDNQLDAVSFVASLNPAFMEKDEDHPGCWDALLNDGRIVSIEKK